MVLAERGKGGKLKGGLGMFIGERFVDKVLDVRVDSENVFFWVVVVI